MAQFVLKIAHLAISMEPPGPRAFSLLAQLWLLLQLNKLSSLKVEIADELFQ